jgi:hypothetical protein
MLQPIIAAYIVLFPWATSENTAILKYAYAHAVTKTGILSTVRVIISPFLVLFGICPTTAGGVKCRQVHKHLLKFPCWLCFKSGQFMN